MSRFFITGVNGFIGSHIAERLKNDGHEVIGLVRKTSDLSLIKHMDLQLHYGDVAQKDSLLKGLAGADIVIHVAGFASDWGSLETFEKINVTGTKNIAYAAAEQNVKRLVHISTVALLGFPNKRNVDETAPLPKTIFPYNESKKDAEIWLFEFDKKTDMEITAVRPGNVFGPRDHTFIDKYLEAIESGKAAYIDGGRHWTCPVYIENLVDAVVSACFTPEAAGEAFNLTDGLEIDWRTFTEKFADALNAKRPKLSVPFYPAYFVSFLMEKIYKLFRAKNAPLLTRYRISNGGRDYHFSIEKARRLLKHEPKVDFDTAVQRTVEWYIKEVRK